MANKKDMMWATEDLTNVQVLRKVEKAAAKLVWYCLKGNPDQARRWSECSKCIKWCAGQRGITMDIIGKYELAGAEKAIEAAAKGDSTEWMEVLA